MDKVSNEELVEKIHETNEEMKKCLEQGQPIYKSYVRWNVFFGFFLFTIISLIISNLSLRDDISIIKKQHTQSVEAFNKLASESIPASEIDESGEIAWEASPAGTDIVIQNTPDENIVFSGKCLEGSYIFYKELSQHSSESVSFTFDCINGVWEKGEQTITVPLYNPR